MKTHLSLSPAQADALARLIQMQLDAYEETVPGGDGHREQPAPFTVGDLELIEPLIVRLRKASKATS